MSSQKARVDKLEAQTGSKDVPAFAVVWPDGRVTVDGETMTEDQLKERWPDVPVLRVVYES